MNTRGASVHARARRRSASDDPEATSLGTKSHSLPSGRLTPWHPATQVSSKTSDNAFAVATAAAAPKGVTPTRSAEERLSAVACSAFPEASAVRTSSVHTRIPATLPKRARDISSEAPVGAIKERRIQNLHVEHGARFDAFGFKGNHRESLPANQGSQYAGALIAGRVSKHAFGSAF